MKYCNVTVQSLSLFPDGLNIIKGQNESLKNEEEKADSKSIHAGYDKFNSVLEIICKTKTHLGSTLLKSWLYSPLSDIDSISRRHFYILHFVANAKLMSTLRDSTLYLSKFPDWKIALNKLENLENKNVTLFDLIIMYRSIIRFQAIGSILETSIADETKNFQSDLPPKASFYQTFHAICSNSNKFEKFLSLVEELLDIDSIKSRYLGNAKGAQLDSSNIWKDDWIRVRPKFSPALNTLHETLVETQRLMQTELTQLNQSLSTTGAKSVLFILIL